MIRISIDAMGGDHGPEVTLAGLLQVATRRPDIRFVIFGQQQVVLPVLERMPKLQEISTFVHCDVAVEMDAKPSQALRHGRWKSSMWKAIEAVKNGDADACISAGNTGALMATGLLVIGRLPGIHRPALAPMIPTLEGSGTLALDLGANMDASPEHLAQYAVMGTIYRSKVHQLDQPRVGLLNVGTEEMKGNELTKAAYSLLEKLPIHFIGNVEARDILSGVCDVVVCDGFAGNIMLKSFEGAQKAIFTLLKQQLTSSALTKIAGLILKPKLRVFKQYDYREHGGAPLLGIDGIVIKSHGSSDAAAIKNAIGQARTALMNHLVDAIREEIKRNEGQL